MTLSDYMPLIALLCSMLLTLFGYGIKLLWDIREHLARLNGRVATCEALRIAHEENDERRHDQCEQQLEIVQRKLMGTP